MVKTNEWVDWSSRACSLRNKAGVKFEKLCVKIPKDCLVTRHFQI